MNQAEQDQILRIVKNLEEKKTYVPYFSDLVSNETYGPIFVSLKANEKEEINQIINAYIIEKIDSITKTKGGQLFKRFFESQPDLFWQFRTLNENPDQTANKFQTVGKQVEHEMFKLEGILTEKMVGQEKGLDKVISSFYNIVYKFFPKMGEVGDTE